MPAVGDVIAGKYRLDKVVGSGGMGVVFAATHTSLAQSVAIKFLRNDPLDRTSAHARLFREARSMAHLTSEYLGRVHDVGSLSDGSPYLVMELLAGTTVQVLVREAGAMSALEASELVIQACHGLGDAHAHGIVHRDVKPSNLFVTRDGGGPRIKVIDFGVAKAPDRQGDMVALETQTGSLLGSPPFMSPEQILAASDVDSRTDLWSLGVVLYFMVTGALPFEARSLLELMTKIAYEPPPSLRAAAPSVPEGFERVVLRCLARRREDRFASAADLAHALVQFAPERARWIAARVAIRVETVASQPVPAERELDTIREPDRAPLGESATVDGVATASALEPARRRPPRALALLLTMTAMGIGVGALVLRSHTWQSSEVRATVAASLPPPVPSAATDPPPAPVPAAAPSTLRPSEPAPALAPQAPVAPAPTSRPRSPHPLPHASPKGGAPVLPTTPD